MFILLTLEKIFSLKVLDRGYTGHEHIFLTNEGGYGGGLINMNGRIFDPILGRMLSPDNYVQSPDFTQSYNRYSYCMNNPLKYIDPSGWQQDEIYTPPSSNWWTTYEDLIAGGGNSAGLGTLTPISNFNYAFMNNIFHGGSSTGAMMSAAHGQNALFAAKSREDYNKLFNIGGHWEKRIQPFRDAGVNMTGVSVLGEVNVTASASQVWVADESNYMAGAIAISLGLASDDVTGVGVLNDLAIPFLLGGAYLLDRYAGKGNPSYPGPWTYTISDPTGNAPFNNPPNGFDPEKNPGWGNIVGWAVGGGFAYNAYNEYMDHINNQNTYHPVIPPLATDKTYVAPKYPH